MFLLSDVELLGSLLTFPKVDETFSERSLTNIANLPELRELRRNYAAVVLTRMTIRLLVPYTIKIQLNQLGSGEVGLIGHILLPPTLHQPLHHAVRVVQQLLYCEVEGVELFGDVVLGTGLLELPDVELPLLHYQSGTLIVSMAPRLP